MNKILPFFLFGFFGVSEAHEDHSSRHGGFVMMFLDLHLELVVPEEGGVEIFYSDEMRRDMPASVVSEVAVTLHRPDGSQEPLEMNVSDQGDRWAGFAVPSQIRRQLFVANFSGKANRLVWRFLQV